MSRVDEVREFADMILQQCTHLDRNHRRPIYRTLGVEHYDDETLWRALAANARSIERRARSEYKRIEGSA